MPSPEEARTQTQPVHRKGRERRKQIIATSRARLIERGVPGLVLRDIAEEMGITHGNLQYYFATKHDLLRAVFDDEVAKFTTGLHDAVQSSGSASGRLSAIIDSCVKLITSEDTKIWRILFSVADTSREFADILKLENDHFEKILATELKGISSGSSEKQRLRIAKIFRSILDGLSIEFIYNDPNGPDVPALKKEIESLLLGALKAK